MLKRARSKRNKESIQNRIRKIPDWAVSSRTNEVTTNPLNTHRRINSSQERFPPEPLGTVACNEFLPVLPKKRFVVNHPAARYSEPKIRSKK